MKVVYIGRGYYFYGDTKPRDIYKIKIMRNGKQYSFRFGQSLANTRSGKKPTAYDVLACLTKYKPYGDVWDFAREFGYVIEDRETYKRIGKIYNGVKREWRGVNRLFGDVLEQLQEIA